MGGRIIRCAGCHKKCRPCLVSVGVRVVIGISGANGSDWAPEIIEILGIESGDEAVCHGKVDQAEKPRVLPRVQFFLSRDDPRDAIPPGWRTFVPESGDFTLFESAGRAVQL